MTQTLYLKQGVHLAVVGDDLVTLDTGADAYACLPGYGAAVGPRGPGGRVDVALADAADRLVETGLVASYPQGASAPAPPPLPTRSIWRTDRVTVTPADRRRLAKAYVKAAPQVWRSSFRNLLRAAARERPAAPDASPQAVRRDALAFDQLMPFAPFQGQCLFRSRLLLAFLRTERRDAAWVFGVRTYPFQAHCWLQAGDTALDDAAERICGYVPILCV
jgi:hypothetical protein